MITEAHGIPLVVSLTGGCFPAVAPDYALFLQTACREVASSAVMGSKAIPFLPPKL